VSEEIEKAVLDHALEHPCHGPLRVAQELILLGIEVSSGGVRRKQVTGITLSETRPEEADVDTLTNTRPAVA